MSSSWESISQLFSYGKTGRGKTPESWKIVDRLEVLFPEGVRRIQQARRDEDAMSILADMLNALPNVKDVTDNERNRLAKWLERLRYGWTSSGGRTQDERDMRARMAHDILGR